MRCPKCGKKGGHTVEGQYLRCKRCAGLFDSRDDGEVYTDPTKRLRLHESNAHEREFKRRQLKGGK